MAEPLVEQDDWVHCRGCGRKLHPTAETCPDCGAPQNVTVQGNKNRIAAALLAFLLGGFGVHKFYLERVGQGIVYLLFFWTGIPAIIAFVECIIYLCTSDREFARKYG